MITASIQYPLDTAGDIQRALLALYRINLELIERNPGRWPSIYAGAVRYLPELQGKEQWLTIKDVFTFGAGDCEDLASARAAQLTAAGIPAVPRVYRAGPNLWHVIVQYEDGRTEDPSARLGMNPLGDLEEWSDDEALSLQDVIVGAVTRRVIEKLRDPVRKLGRPLVRLAESIPVASQGLDAARAVRDVARDARGERQAIAPDLVIMPEDGPDEGLALRLASGAAPLWIEVD